MVVTTVSQYSGSRVIEQGKAEARGNTHRARTIHIVGFIEITSRRAEKPVFWDLVAEFEQIK
ncbi:hypothetical protein ACFL0V_01135 [Nanoarchaeota archaeon]